VHVSKHLNEQEKSKSGWKQNPEAVQRDIIAAAIVEFAKSGFSSAKIDDIAARTKTSKRMIYYYFGDKEGLYIQALEAAYGSVRVGERALNLDGMPPLQALERLVAFTFDHHRRNPDFIRMVMIENVHHAEHLRRSKVVRDVNLGAISRLQGLIERGEADGSFRPGLNATELHWQISALSVFNVSNKPTFSALYGKSLFTAAGQKSLRERAAEMILAAVRNSEGPTR
jgi:AcrR family transcriptional regulator